MDTPSVVLYRFQGDSEVELFFGGWRWGASSGSEHFPCWFSLQPISAAIPLHTVHPRHLLLPPLCTPTTGLFWSAPLASGNSISLPFPSHFKHQIHHFFHDEQYPCFIFLQFHVIALLICYWQQTTLRKLKIGNIWIQVWWENVGESLSKFIYQIMNDKSIALLICLIREFPNFFRNITIMWDYFRFNWGIWGILLVRFNYEIMSEKTIALVIRIIGEVLVLLRVCKQFAVYIWVLLVFCKWLMYSNYFSHLLKFNLPGVFVLHCLCD